MKLLFIGHGVRGVECLKALISENYEIKAVIVQSGASQGNESLESSVFLLAQQSHIPVLEPENINAAELRPSISELDCDIAVIAAYNQILKQPFLDLFAKGVINLHGGKLPEYRGGSPIYWQIINGEKKGACSIIQVDKGIDTGDLLAEQLYDIGPDETGSDVKKRVSAIFPALLVSTLKKIENGECALLPQDESCARYYCQRNSQDSEICWSAMTDLEVHNLVRAMNVEGIKSAFSCVDGQEVSFISSSLLETTYMGNAGKIAFPREDGMVIICRNRGLLIVEAAVGEAPKGNAAIVLKAFQGKYLE
jgi:methionyl-tRNA formyltransferase